MKRCLLAAMLLLCLCGCGRTDRIAHQTIVTALEITPAEDGWQLAEMCIRDRPIASISGPGSVSAVEAMKDFLQFIRRDRFAFAAH